MSSAESTCASVVQEGDDDRRDRVAQGSLERRAILRRPPGGTQGESVRDQFGVFVASAVSVHRRLVAGKVSLEQRRQSTRELRAQ